MITEELKKLYCTYTGHEPETIEELPSSGSNRRYFRLTGTPTLIGVSGTSLEENQAFLYMADHFRKKGLPVPQVIARVITMHFICKKTWETLSCSMPSKKDARPVSLMKKRNSFCVRQCACCQPYSSPVQTEWTSHIATHNQNSTAAVSYGT